MDNTKKPRYDFKKMMQIAKSEKYGYRIKNYWSGSLFGLRYWISINGIECSCSHPQKSMLEAHNSARFEILEMLDRNGVIKKEELEIK